MGILNILADFAGWCSEQGTKDVFHIIRSVIEILRFVVPIGLIAMTTVDIAKKVINPDEKDGQKKLMTRLIAAVIVFLIPIMITLTLRLIDIGMGDNSNVSGDSKSGLSECWGS